MRILIILLLFAAPALAQESKPEQPPQPPSSQVAPPPPVQTQPRPQPQQAVAPQPKGEMDIWIENGTRVYLPFFLIFYLALRLASAHGPLRFGRRRLSEDEYAELEKLRKQARQ